MAVLKNLRFFIWVIIPAGLYLTWQVYGLPHMIWTRSWIDNGQGMDPYAYRYYTDCTYVGPYGGFHVQPGNGKCVWVRFFKDTSIDRRRR